MKIAVFILFLLPVSHPPHVFVFSFFREMTKEFNVRIFFSCRLEGTEEKFRNRESRPEDLQTIAELREMVAERECLIKKLVVSVCALTAVRLSYTFPRMVSQPVSSVPGR